MSTQQIAILIDGGFFLKRIRRLLPPGDIDTPEKIARAVRKLCFQHVMRLKRGSGRNWQQHLYRAFFYDAQPYTGKAHHPIANKSVDFSQSDVALHREALFQCLRKERKVALRLGKVTREHDWSLLPKFNKDILKTRQQLSPLQTLLPLLQNATDTSQPQTLQVSFTPEQAMLLAQAYNFWHDMKADDVALGLRQKGVDMRIAIDIASITLKKQAQTIILVSGDSDFVPAAKLARREGMEFILDPLWQHVNDDLFEHIDGLQSGIKRPQLSDAKPPRSGSIFVQIGDENVHEGGN